MMSFAAFNKGKKNRKDFDPRDPPPKKKLRFTNSNSNHACANTTITNNLCSYQSQTSTVEHLKQHILALKYILQLHI